LGISCGYGLELLFSLLKPEGVKQGDAAFEGGLHGCLTGDRHMNGAKLRIDGVRVTPFRIVMMMLRNKR
jgi:hypothetical protein